MSMNKQRKASNLMNILTYDAAGNVTIPANLQVGSLSSGSVTLSSAVNTTVNTNKFLVLDAGLIKYKTAAQVLSEIGGQPAGSYVTTNTTITINGTTYDLSTNRSWTITAGVWGQITGTLSAQTDLQNALDAKVPTARTITINGITYDLSTNRAWSAIPTGGAAGDILAKVSGSDYDVTWISNYTSSVKHYVKLGVNMTIGTPVYVSSGTGNSGNNMIVSKASNTSEATSSKTMGLIAATGVINDERFVITEGLLPGVDTSAAQIADPVWLGPNGTLIFGLANKPVAPAHLVYLGVVTRVHANNGEIFVKVQNGYELEELHDVLVSTYINNGVLYRDTATNLWKHATINTILGYAPVTDARTITINGTAYDLTANRSWSVGTVTSIATSGPITGGTITGSGTIGITQATTSTDGYLSSTDWNTFNNKYNLPSLTSGSVLFSNGTTIAQDNANFFWDNTNKRLGIGINTPQRTLHVHNPSTGLVSLQLTNTTSGTTNLDGFQVYGDGTNYVFGNFENGYAAYLTNATERMRIFAGGNIAIGTTTDAGYKLQVQGNFYLKGSDNFSSTVNFLVQNSLGSNIIQFDNGGGIYAGSVNTPRLFTTGAGLTIDALYAGSNWVKISTAIFSNNVVWLTPSASITKTSGDSTIALINQTLAPTSGTTTASGIRIEQTINQTGGANGITRGLYVKPTLTAAADWRAIEIATGGVYVNTTSVQGSAILQADSTTKGFLPPRMTAAQRTAISTPANGLIVFQTDSVEGVYQYKSTGWEIMGGAVARRSDFVVDTSYMGVAPFGSADSATVWKIYKIVVSSSGVTTKTTATNVAWTDRLTATYS